MVISHGEEGGSSEWDRTPEGASGVLVTFSFLTWVTNVLAPLVIAL